MKIHRVAADSLMARQFRIFIFFILTVLAIGISGCESDMQQPGSNKDIEVPDAPVTEDPARAVENNQTLAPAPPDPVAPDPGTRYFFDVYGHSPAEMLAVLQRARDTYENLPNELHDAVRIAIVLHGPDVEYFATAKYEQYKDLVDLAAQLDAFGFVDLKMCTVSVRSRGLPLDKFPPFIELVPYGPAEISRLEGAGYIQL